MIRQLKITHGPIVKWYYAAFALLRRESDSPWVHYEFRNYKMDE
jgi:hypothetical protein